MISDLGWGLIMQLIN